MLLQGFRGLPSVSPASSPREHARRRQAAQNHNETVSSLSSGSYRDYRGTESRHARPDRHPPMELAHSLTGCYFHPSLQRRGLRLSCPPSWGVSRTRGDFSLPPSCQCVGRGSTLCSSFLTHGETEVCGRRRAGSH